MNEKFKKLKKYWSPLCLLINLTVYVGFALIDGPVWCRDSNSYATMDYTREPIYPTFLWIMRKIFGENVMVHGWDLTDRLGGKVAAEEPLYLMATIVCQSILAAVTLWLLVKTCYEIGKKFRYAAMANLVMWGVDILNRFGAKRGSTYTQSIMTEGFGISFYILFLLSLFQYLRRCIRLEKEKAAAGRSIGKNGKEWKKYLLLTVLMMTICASQHKQLTITLIIFAASVFFIDVSLLRKEMKTTCEKNVCSENTYEQDACRKDACGKIDIRKRQKNGRGVGRWFARDLSALVCAGVLIFLIGHIYNLTFHGVWSFHTGSADKIDSTLLYTVTEEDARLFSVEETAEAGKTNAGNDSLAANGQDTGNATEDAETGGQDTGNAAEDAETGGQENAQMDDPVHLRDLFLQIEEEMTEQRLRYVDVKADEKVTWVELCSHYADSYDIIGFEVLDPLVDTYVRTYCPELTPGSMEFAIATDHVCQSLERVLLRQNPKRLLYLWINNIRKGFVNTVLRVSTVLNWASLALWILYGTMLGILVRRLHRMKENGTGNPEKAGEKMRDTILLAALVLLGTVVNCAVVGAIIFPQTRYMIYNMGLFYIALFLMLGTTDVPQ